MSFICKATIFYPIFCLYFIIISGIVDQYGCRMSPPTDTIARKWRKLKKRCSFSGSDRAERLIRSKSFTEPEIIAGKKENGGDNHYNGDFHENNRLAETRITSDKEKYLTVGSKDMPKFQGLRDRISQWNSELKKRRASTENLSALQAAKIEAAAANSGGSSLITFTNSNNYKITSEENSMFVMASPKQGYVKSAVVISSNAKESTTVIDNNSPIMSKSTSLNRFNHYNNNTNRQPVHRISPRNSTPVKSSVKEINSKGSETPHQQHSPLADSLAWSSPSPSPPVSEDSGEFHHHHNQRNTSNSNDSTPSPFSNSSSSQQMMFMDQDSGYDGFCPEKSIYSTGSSETSSLLSSDGHENGMHHANQYPMSADYTFPRARTGRPRPSPIYEKHSEYGNRDMLRDSNTSSSSGVDTSPMPSRNSGSMNHYGTVNTSPRAKIAQATVVNLVNKSHNHPRQYSRQNQSPPCTPPPPLPPRPALHPVSPNSLPPIPSSLTKPIGRHNIQHGAVSLPRKKIEFAERVRRRGSYHDDQPTAADAGRKNSSATLDKRSDIHIGSELVLEPLSKVGF